MGRVKGISEEEAALTDVIARARASKNYTASDAADTFSKHGMSLIDDRLWGFLEDLPVGLDDLVEDEDEDE